MSSDTERCRSAFTAGSDLPLHEAEPEFDRWLAERLALERAIGFADGLAQAWGDAAKMLDR